MLLAAACVALPVGRAHAAFQGTNGLIAYSCGANVCAAHADGTGEVVLVAGASDPAWSSDGSQIAYVPNSGGIDIAPVSGGVAGGAQQLVSAATASQPSWSPDGTKVAFADSASGIKTIGTASGSTAQTVTSTATDVDPAWSPDGSQIAYASQAGGHYDILVRRVDSTGAGTGSSTPLTSNGTGNDRHPNWSPDGSLIVYSSSSGVGSPLLYDMNSDGSAQTKLGPSAGVTGDDPVWSPDGTLILFADTNGLETLDDTGASPSSPPFVSGSNLASPDWQPISNTISSSGPPQIVTYPTITLPSGFDAPQLGLFLTTTAGTWKGATPITFKYQWTKCNDKLDTKPCYDIAGATSSFFTPTPDLVGWDMSVTVTATNSQGTFYVRALPTKPVTGAAPVNHGSPRITGTNTVASMLSSDTGVWRGYFPITYAYQWKRCDPLGTLTSCVAIPGATSSTYILQDADLNQTIRIFVTATNAVGSATQFSNHTFPTLPQPHFAPASLQPPQLTGTVQPGFLLRTTYGSWSGDLPQRYQYAWGRCDATGGECITVPGQTRNRYTITAKDVGFTLRVSVTATNAYGTATALSDPTDTIAGQPLHARGRRLVGTKGADYILGTPRDDVILGGAGNDTINGDGGYDKIDGGSGNDVISVPGPAASVVDGGSGSDTIRAANGFRDIVDCGPGQDRLIADSIDKATNCEVVSVVGDSGTGGGSGGTTTGPTTTGPTGSS